MRITIPIDRLADRDIVAFWSYWADGLQRAILPLPTYENVNSFREWLYNKYKEQNKSEVTVLEKENYLLIQEFRRQEKERVVG